MDQARPQALSEDYFATRGLRYRGPKESFQWLKIHQPDVYGAFEKALVPNATLESIESLIEITSGPRDSKVVRVVSHSNNAGIIGLSHVLLFVKSVEQSRSWYQKVLGIKPTIEIENFAEFRVGTRRRT